VYFGEWEDFTTSQIQWFLFGAVVTFAGLFVLTQKENHSISDDPRRHSSIAMSTFSAEDSKLIDEFGLEEESDDDGLL